MCNSPHYLLKLNVKNDNIDIRPKLKNCLFPAPDWPLENVATCNIFWVICDYFFFFFFFGYRKSWPEVPILFQNLRSELVYTFKWTKSIARLWRNQICEWTLKKKKKNCPTYRPIGEMEGKVRETNIFFRVALLFSHIFPHQVNDWSLHQWDLRQKVTHIWPLNRLRPHSW